MKLSLEDREWGEFKVGNLFEIEKCKCNNVSILQNGKIPYIGATNRNNGIMSFIENKNKLLTKGNCIVFICDGQGSGGYSIYKKEDFIGSTTLKVGRNKYLNRYSGLFLTSALDKNRSIYNYGYKRNENRLKNEVIMLPINKENTPDWQFMEDYAREIEEEKISNYTAYITEALKEIEFKKIEKLEEKEWGEFKIEELFEVCGSKTTKLKDLIESNNETIEFPYITTKATNNGIDGFYKCKTEKGNVITFDSATIGYLSYQRNDFSASDHVEILSLKNHTLNKYIAHFMISVINKSLDGKFNYGFKLSQKRMKKQTVKIPINKDKTPDYAYMEQYIKNIMHEKYNKYLNFKGININKEKAF